MNSIILQETDSDIVLRALRQADGSITMDIGLDDKLGKIINVDKKQDCSIVGIFAEKHLTLIFKRL